MGLRRYGFLGAAAVVLAAGAAFADEQGSIDFANGLFTRGFYEDAATEYRVYLAEFSDGQYSADALFRLGESELAMKRYSEAVAAFDQLLNRADASAHVERARLRRAVALYESGDRAEAEIALRRTADAAATAAEAYYYLGKLYFDSGRPQESIAAFEELTRLAPGHALVPFARYQMAFGLLNLGDAEKAAIQFTEIANSDAADASLRVECRFRAAETYDRLGWFEAAVSAYEALTRDYPESEYARRAAYGYAWSLYHAAKYPEAAVAIEQFLEQNPESPERPGMHFLRGNCLIQLARYNDAIAAFEEIRTAYPESEFAGRAQYRAAWAKHLSGDDDAALNDLDAMLQDGRQLASAGEAAYLRGEILADRGDFEGAYEEFRLVANQYGDSEFAPEALFKGGECLSKLNRHAEAMTAFDEYALRHSQTALADEALLRAGDAAFLSKDLAGAVDRYSKLVRKAPGGDVEEEGLFRLGIALHDISNFKMCAETLLKLLEKFPNTDYAAEAHLLVADVYLEDSEDPVRAIGHYQSALKSSPEGKHAGDALKGLALARYEAKDYPGAAESFVELIRKYPEVSLNAETYVWLGDQLYQSGDWENAIAVYGAFIERIPGDGQHALAWFRTGESYAALENPDRAIAAFGHVAETAPKSALAADAQLKIARQLEKDGQIDKAVALYEESADANNGESAARARFKLGEIYEARGDFETAAKHFMRVAILFLHEELSPESLLRAASCYSKLDDTEKASQTFDELIREFPDSAQAASARELLARN